METVAIIAAVNAAIDLIAKLEPVIAAKIQAGEISADTQSALNERIAALRPGGRAFAGPEWKPSVA